MEGHRRIHALKYLNQDSVSCEIKILETDELNKLTSLILNTARKNWNIIAVSRSLRELYDKGYTQEKLAQFVGKDRTTILRMLKISLWPTQALQLLMKAIKEFCNIEKKETASLKQKNLSKFNSYVKSKHFSEHEMQLIKEALSELGFI